VKLLSSQRSEQSAPTAASAQQDGLFPGVRGMRIVATGMLIVMAAVYIGTRPLLPMHPAWGFVRAFAEAAMVGGLADWFAVTALFRHPMGIPIPHTAIIPRNKDRIGTSLANFLRDNFLIPAVVARRMRKVDIAAAAGEFLMTSGQASDGTNGDGRLRLGASRMVGEVLEALDHDRLGSVAKGALVHQLRDLDIAPLLGQLLNAAIKDKRHQPILNSFIHWAGETMDANEEIIRAIVSEKANTIMRWTGLDERLANAVVDGLQKLVHDMAGDTAHPLRSKGEEGLVKLAHDLQHDAELQARVVQLKAELIENPAMGKWINGLWEQGRATLLNAARDPDTAMAGRLGEVLTQLGTTLTEDEVLKRQVNRFARRAVVGATSSYGDKIVSLVSDTVQTWDAQTITDRLENSVGRDLQYIRVNGTLVGGSVGVILHLANHYI